MDAPLTAALAAIDAVTLADDQGTLRATARGLMSGYNARWANAEWQSLSVEEQFLLPIVNPDTGRTSRTFRWAGKVDGIVAYKGEPFLREAKTCSEDIADPNAPWWRRLAIDAQVSSYVLAKWQDGLKVKGTLYDCIRKPGIRPKQITKADRKDLVYAGTYCGQAVSGETRRLVATLEQENDELYELRLMADTLSRPEWYFQRRTIPRLDADLLDYSREQWQIADEIRQANLLHRHFRNSSACMNYGVPCAFLGLCSGQDTPTSDRWTKKENVHTELPLLPMVDIDNRAAFDSRAVLTHSSMSTFKTCRRKYYYKYLQGIERADKEEYDSIILGNLIHDALAAWWSNLVPTTEEQLCQTAQ